jgi:phosphoribosylanthranilate isomerase
LRIGVKVCGLTRVEDGRAAAAAGADAVGFVFWPRSPRVVAPERAREIASALPPFVARVGVFVDEDPAAITRIAQQVGLDVVQLHGDEPLADLDRLPRRVVKALRLGDGARAAIGAWSARGAGILLDAGMPGQPGGTGRRLDWPAVRALRDSAPWLMLAGGLDASNVAEAIRVASPDAVDVSSGVESAPGVKDPERVAAFVRAARAAGEERA